MMGQQQTATGVSKFGVQKETMSHREFSGLEEFRWRKHEGGGGTSGGTGRTATVAAGHSGLRESRAKAIVAPILQSFNALCRPAVSRRLELTRHCILRPCLRPAFAFPPAVVYVLREQIQNALNAFRR
ncbi:hypothetical protein Nepgr_020053 [Nepenthes gracilis]|uniref:Uncharacterized protein n=1 Tax=Nepenthes gracilis TaxID=150966 RepID=A0AAD3SX99_NEPGR|nr:hypothetical protein Nepgr_020053 [Nepenthes gracilis]